MTLRTSILGFATAVSLCLPAVAAEGPAVFASPQDALDALIRGLEVKNRDEVIAVFGTDALDVISSGEAPRDRIVWGEFLELYKQGYRFSPQEDGTVELVVGEDDWPVPIPLRKTDAGWIFDAEAGREEILARRIGFNELAVLELMQGYVDIQTDFRTVDYDEDGVMEFASHIVSSAEDKDGLYWPGEDSPLGDLFARASALGYSLGDQDEEPEPFYGYFYRILNAQGPDAPGGEMDYIVNGNQVSGHALIAYPAVYGDTGIMSFIVSENGVVLEADLGEDTAAVASVIDRYNPTEEWTPAED